MDQLPERVGVRAMHGERPRRLSRLAVAMDAEFAGHAGAFVKPRQNDGVIDGILGKGVAYNARFDPQAKGLGEWLRSRHVDIPEEILG